MIDFSLSNLLFDFVPIFIVCFGLNILISFLYFKEKIQKNYYAFQLNWHQSVKNYAALTLILGVTAILFLNRPFTTVTSMAFGFFLGMSLSEIVAYKALTKKRGDGN